MNRGKLKAVVVENPVAIENQKPDTINSPNRPLKSEGKIWANILTGKILAAKGMSLTYILPVMIDGERVVQLQVEEIAEETKKWNRALILYVVGDSPSIGAVGRIIATNWNFAAKPKVYYHNDDYFVIQFDNLEDRYALLYSRPYAINSKPVIVKPWSPEFNLGDEVLHTIPLWVQLPNLQLNCWGLKTLSRIGSGLGTPLFTDACTSGVDHLSYARTLVQMDVTKELPTSVKVQDPNGKMFSQPVEYNWKPLYCHTFLQVGHSCQQVTINNQNNHRQVHADSKQKQVEPMIKEK
ncbi:uncharacterized protein [Nicotiana tomentosiformis]|uniref:uncharacterized protein n=1 Tax=Nicotiana tomentosiformis TaxID=4098 RepID=UPI00388CE42E